MKDIKSISAKLWKLIVRLALLLWHLSRQVDLPTRRRKGNVLNTLFLFYIGVIENFQHFEHRQFKLSGVFQNKLARKGLMLFGFLLFLLTSFEQPVSTRTGVDESSKVQYCYQNTVTESTYNCSIEAAGIKPYLQPILNAVHDYSSFLIPARPSAKLYLENRRLII